MIVSVMHHHEEGALSSEIELQALKERGVEAVNKVLLLSGKSFSFHIK